MEPIAPRLYTTAQVREIDRRAVAAVGGDALILMERAGAAAFRRLRAHWPEARRITIVCGRGNNGGDGWVVARLAQQAGLVVQVVQPSGEPNTDTARRSRAAALAGGVSASLVEPGEALPAADVVVDAVLGIGLSRAPESEAATLIDAIGRAAGAVFALDVPSGLDADTGHAPGVCVRADLTLCLLAAKRGLCTGRAADLVGALEFDALDVDPARYADVGPYVSCASSTTLRNLLPPRHPGAHKGHGGHVLAIGGDHGYGGAIRLTAEAALRSGAGLVSVATREPHVGALIAARPELMVRGVETPAALAALIERADVIAVGPGLGTTAWGQALLTQALSSQRPLVLDADALNAIVHRNLNVPAHCVLTPHPGEAARLLGCSAAEIQADRFEAARRLAARYSAVVLLKGAGTLVAVPDGGLSICPHAEPALASGGTGDVLTGVVAALMAQGLPLPDAALYGALIHLRAARAAARGGVRGTLAGDVVDCLRAEVNP